MKKLGCIYSLLVLILFTGNSYPNSFPEKQKVPIAIETLSLQDTIPVSPKVIKRTLKNGLTYYIRANKKPENRAELRLVVKAGSVLENEQQQGLAHFVEHMAFNGTEHFEKQQLVDYLERIGMRFGPDINAYTSFDETVYKLQIPTDSSGFIETGFQVLEDWAHALNFADEEIEKERGVVIEEWRLRRGAGARIWDQQFPVLFKGSRYAQRQPIGEKSVLDTFHYEAPRQFYGDWYRPDLMAVIAVGDFQVPKIEQLIRTHFGSMPRNIQALARPQFPVPPHDETLYSVVTDPEATYASVSLNYKMKPARTVTVDDYRRQMAERLYHSMFNQRLAELTKQEHPPILNGFSTKSQFVESSEIYFLHAIVKENGIKSGLETLLTEARRVKQHGFTSTELERQKKSLLRHIEQRFRERDKMESRRFVSRYIRNFLNREPIPGMEYQYKLYQKYIPGITLEEVNRLADQWITDSNRVVMVSAPEKEGVEIPTISDLQAAMDEAGTNDVEPYVDDILEAPLVETIPKPGRIAKENYIDQLDITEWTLDNGIKVVMKPTDFKNDEIRFTAYSPGGYSLVPDSNLVAAQTAASVVREGGLGIFSQTQLQKLLAGKVVRVTPYIDQLWEGLNGHASPEDVETMFQLIYLYFTKPRTDSTAFAAYQSRMKGYYQNRSASPEAAFHDTLTATITRHHPRFQPWTVEKLDRMNLQKSIRIYGERFADAGDFIVFLVGNFQPEEIKPLVKSYLGGLPDQPGSEHWRDVTYEFPEEIIQKKIRRGLEPKSLTAIVFYGPFDWSPENRYKANAMLSVLRIKLRQRIREELGGTYGVRVNGSFSHYPRERYQISINYGSDPERVMELTEQIFSQIDSLKTGGTTEEYLTKVKEMDLREYETNLQENTFWLNSLKSHSIHGINPMNILEMDDRIRRLTLEDIQAAAQDFLNTDRYIRVVLYPGDYKIGHKKIENTKRPD